MGSLIDAAPVVTAAADFPEVCVEWLPTQGPGVSDGDWCDISAYVKDGSTNRGRQYELDRFQSGTLTLTLAASDRRFDPDHTTGPFYPWLVPMRQIRVSAVWNGVRYPIFHGYITEWGNATPADELWETSITAQDAFLVLEQLTLPSSAWALEIQNDNPTAWFRLGESDTARVTDSTANGNYGLYNCEQGATGLVVNDADGAAKFAHSLEERIVIQNTDLLTDWPFSFSCMFKIDSSQPDGFKVLFNMLAAPPDTTQSLLTIAMDSGGLTGTPGTVLLYILDSTATGQYVWSSIRCDDDEPHHLAVVAATSTKTDWYIYIDGVDVTTRGGGSAPAWPGQPAGWTIGNYTDLLSGDYGFGANGDGLSTTSQDVRRGTIDEVCVWNGTAITSTRVAAHAAAALTGWAGDTTGTRVSRFLDAIGWPATLRDIQTGISTLGAASWSVGTSALSALQNWADTETGLFFISRDGKIVWKSRHSPLLDTEATTSQATFSDTGTIKYDIDEFELKRDDTLIRNPVTAQRANGVIVTVSDAALIEKYGERSWTAPTTEDNSDATVRDRAVWLLRRFKERATRLRSMRITPRRDPSVLWPQVLGREIGDRITVSRKPLQLNASVSVDQIIEGVAHQFSPQSWRTTFVAAPVDPNVGSYLILDDASTGLLDTGLLAY